MAAAAVMTLRSDGTTKALMAGLRSGVTHRLRRRCRSCHHPAGVVAGQGGAARADGLERAVRFNSQPAARPRDLPLEARGVLAVRDVVARPSVKAFEGALPRVPARLGVTVWPSSAAKGGARASTHGGSAPAGLDFIEAETVPAAGR